MQKDVNTEFEKVDKLFSKLGATQQWRPEIRTLKQHSVG
jgi:hypothetical protein